ncbi:hypothetical protein QJQ45_004961 [Haematococcus lacustris]|nr:hypothetical protein QJQ45_004961 [Haematococcus lacustris]
MPPKGQRKRPVSPAQSAAGASGSGQHDQGQGQAVKKVIAERRQVIKAAFRGLVVAARPDLSPAQVDAVVAEVNKRMTMGSKQCCLAAILAAPAQLPPPVQLNILDPQLLVQIRDAMELITKASPSSAWTVAMLKQLDEGHVRGDNNSLNANATNIITSIQDFYRHPGRFIRWWCKAVGVVEEGFSRAMKKHFPQLVLGRLDYSLPDRQHKWRLPPNSVLRQPRWREEVVNGMKWVSRHYYHQERGVVVFLGAGNFSQGGWKAGAVRAGFRKVVEQPSRPSADPRPNRLVIVDEFRTSRVSSSVHARQPSQDPPAPAQAPPPPPHAQAPPAQAQPPPPAQAQPPPAAPGPAPRPQAPPGGRWLDRDTNGCLNLQRIGESRQRPIELCRWDDLEALPPIGKEYQQGYKLVNDRLPKGRQWLHRAAEYRRGIDGRARNNA